MVWLWVLGGLVLVLAFLAVRYPLPAHTFFLKKIETKSCGIVMAGVA
jgi:hypothetical protein